MNLKVLYLIRHNTYLKNFNIRKYLNLIEIFNRDLIEILLSALNGNNIIVFN